MDFATFFKLVRSSVFGGSLTKGQVDGMENIINYRNANYSGVTDDQLAYILATVFHETARKMVPVKEAGSEAYLRSKKYYPYIGVGLVQVTWLDNWRRFGITSVANGLSWPVALHACYAGMVQGLFTGKKLSDYIANGKRDYVNARRIINGTDRAALVASYADSFRIALNASRVSPSPVPVPPLPTPEPDLRPTGLSYEQFCTWLVKAIQENEEVQNALVEILFPDDPAADPANPNDELHPDYGPDDFNTADMVVKGYEARFPADDQPDERYG